VLTENSRSAKINELIRSYFSCGAETVRGSTIFEHKKATKSHRHAASGYITLFLLRVTLALYLMGKCTFLSSHKVVTSDAVRQHYRTLMLARKKLTSKRARY